MSVESLKCKECGTTYELERQLRLRELLRPARGRLRPLRRSTRPRRKRRIQAGSQGIWRYADFLPFDGPPRRPARAGPDAAGARRPAGRAARARGRALDQERRRQPDPLLQGPGRRRRRRQGAGARLRDRRLRLDRQPRQRRRRPRRRRRARLLRLRPRQPRGAEAARHRRLRDQPGRRPRQLRRRQPALHRSCAETRPWAFVNVNLRPYYAEGSKTLAYETVEQLGWELPDRVVCPIASGSLFTKLGRGFQEWLDLGLVEGEQPIFNGAQAAGLQPGRHRLRRRLGRLQAAAAGDDRQEPGDRRPGRRPLRGRARAPHRRRRSTRSTDDEIRDGDQAAGRDDRDLHRDRRRRHRRRPARSSPSAARSAPASGSSSTSPARA